MSHDKMELEKTELLNMNWFRWFQPKKFAIEYYIFICFVVEFFLSCLFFLSSSSVIRIHISLCFIFVRAVSEFCVRVSGSWWFFFYCMLVKNAHS